MSSQVAVSPRYLALLELLRAADTVWNASRAFFARWDLHPSQFNVLNVLRDQPRGLSQTELSHTLVMHRSNLTGLVDELETRGLVRRHAAPGDRRSWRVVLTPGGRRLLRAVLPSYFEQIEAALAHIPCARARLLTADLRRVREHALQLTRPPPPLRV